MNDSLIPTWKDGRSRSHSWSSPPAPLSLPTSTTHRQHHHNNVDSSLSTTQGFQQRVKIIGYLPDLQPLYRNRRLSSQSTGDLGSSLRGGGGGGGRGGGATFLLNNLDDDELPWSPSTPFLSALNAADPRDALGKWFREGSVRGSVFNLCSATLGAGALSLPYAFAKSGWVRIFAKISFFLFFVRAELTTFSFSFSRSLSLLFSSLLFFFSHT